MSARTPRNRLPLPAVGILLGLALAGCTTTPTGTDVSFETMDEGSQGREEAGEEVVGDRAAWQAFWHDHVARTSGRNAAATPPQVDFDERFVIAVYAGQKNTGGYAIQVTGITHDGHGYEAEVRTAAPGEGCITTDALTYPFHVVLVDRADGDDGGTPDVSFDHETDTYTC